jgi:hypothetical protein
MTKMNSVESIVIRSSVRFCLLAVVLAIAVSGCEVKKPTPAGATSAADAAAMSDDEIRTMLDKAIEHAYRSRHLNSIDHAAWQIFHGVLAYGDDFLIYDGDGNLVRATDYALAGNRITGWTLRPGTPNLLDGRQGLVAVVEPAVDGLAAGQGHKDQWLAVLAQADLPTDREVVLGEQKFTMGDLVAQSLNDIHNHPELSWSIIGLSRYVPLDQKWTAGDGTEWSIERIARHEAEQDIDNSACGGTHRMIGMTMAVNRRREAAGPIDPAGNDGWSLAYRRIQEKIKLAQTYQQEDGSYSAAYFRRAARTPDSGEQLGTSGHTLEFLSLALDDEQLQQPWVTRGVVHMCRLLEITKDLELDCGKLYHAMHGLVLYRQRRFGPLDFDRWAEEELAAAQASEAGDDPSAPLPAGE